MPKTIGILTGGGDVPGLNPAIKAVVYRASDSGDRVIGIRRGWAGLLYMNPDDPESVAQCSLSLTRDVVRKIDREGGTFLHSSRTNPGRVQAGDVPKFLSRSQLTKDMNGLYDCTPHVLRCLGALGIDSLIPIGGDDTLSYGHRLYKEGFPVVAIPKTMDNDVFGTDYCIGFSTAVSRSVEYINQLRTSIGSHERIGIVELFGRNSGETSLLAAYLSGVDRAVISEVPFDPEKLTRFLVEDKKRSPSNYSIMTISEGAVMIGGSVIESGPADAYGHRKLGGIGAATAEEIKRISRGENIIYQQLAYLMRSGAPDSLDQMVATNYGTLAVDLIRKGEIGQLVVLSEGRYCYRPMDIVAQGVRRVDVANFYDTEQFRPKVASVLNLPMFLT